MVSQAFVCNAFNIPITFLLKNSKIYLEHNLLKICGKFYSDLQPLTTMIKKL